MAMTRKLWSINALAVELKMDRRAIAKCLDGVPPASEKKAGRRLERRWYLTDVVAAIIDRTGSAGTPQQEKARLDRLRADEVEFNLAVKRGEFAPIDVLRHVLGDVSAQLVAILEALPKRIKHAQPALTARGMKVIESEITRARNAAADIRVKLPTAD